MPHSGAVECGQTRGRGRLGAIVLAGLVLPLTLGACDGRKPKTSATPPAALPAAAPVGPAPWFICDALDAPSVLIVSRPDAKQQVTIMTIDKSDLHPPAAVLYTLGASDGAAGSVFQTLSRDGVEVGHVRTLNTGALPDPAAASTAPVTEVKIDQAILSCRWMGKTRLFGVAPGRTVLITEDDDGPVYRSFDFKDVTAAQPVRPDGAQRSSVPTLEIHGGRREGDRFVFNSHAFTYAVGPTGVSTSQADQTTGSEPFVAVQVAAQ